MVTLVTRSLKHPPPPLNKGRVCVSIMNVNSEKEKNTDVILCSISCHLDHTLMMNNFFVARLQIQVLSQSNWIYLYWPTSYLYFRGLKYFQFCNTPLHRFMTKFGEITNWNSLLPKLMQISSQLSVIRLFFIFLSSTWLIHILQESICVTSLHKIQ